MTLYRIPEKPLLGKTPPERGSHQPTNHMKTVSLFSYKGKVIVCATLKNKVRGIRLATRLKCTYVGAALFAVHGAPVPLSTGK